MTVAQYGKTIALSSIERKCERTALIGHFGQALHASDTVPRDIESSQLVDARSAGFRPHSCRTIVCAIIGRDRMSHLANLGFVWFVLGGRLLSRNPPPPL